LIVLFFYVFGYGLGAGPITWLYLADTLPSIGVGFVAMFGDLFAILIGEFYPVLSTSTNLGYVFTFIIYFVCSIIGVIFVYFCIIETKGKSMKKIWEEYGIKKRNL